MNLDAIELPSNKKFGLFFTAIFVLCGGFFTIKANLLWAVVFGVLATLTLLLSLTKSDWLLPFNKLWMRIGLLLGMIVSPIVLGLLFFLLITPIALVMRVVGRDELKLKQSDQDSYWIDRTPSGPAPSSFKNQF